MNDSLRALQSCLSLAVEMSRTIDWLNKKRSKLGTIMTAASKLQGLQKERKRRR